jgi:hypothetical protein
MRRPGYREAVEWLVLNDDVEWATYDPVGETEARASVSVTGALVRDLFGVETERLRADIRRGIKRLRT